MDLGIIVAVSENNVIGKENSLPWNIPEDLRHFREKTMGLPIIMGRKTYESIGKPLKGRRNIILSRNYSDDGIEVYNSLDSVFDMLNSSDTEKAYIIGGGSVYTEAFPFVNFLDITKIHKRVEGDTYFPEIDLKKWREVSREDHGEFSFLKYLEIVD